MYGWQGMAYDAESGLWDNNAREYSPTIGRFTAIESMFQELGGVPRRLTSGNPKCFALEASNYEPILNPVIERFAAHYGVRMERLPPADPEKKGKIERPMPYVCRLYEAHGGDWLGLVATAGEEMRWKR